MSNSGNRTSKKMNNLFNNTLDWLYTAPLCYTMCFSLYPQYVTLVRGLFCGAN